MVGWKDVPVGVTRRRFTLEFRTEAAHRVIDTTRSVRDVASELSVLENSLSKWVRDERRRMETLKGSGGEALSSAERAAPPAPPGRRTGQGPGLFGKSRHDLAGHYRRMK
jgi:transposase